MNKKLTGLFITLFILSSAAFAEEVFPKPAVITFYKANCAECDSLNNVRQEMAQRYKDKVDFAKINIEVDDCDFDNLKNRYNINTAPTTLFLNSQYGITKKTSGYIPKKLYEKQIEAIIVK